MHKITLLLLMLALLGQGCISVQIDGVALEEFAEQTTGFIGKTMDVDGETRRYVVYVPEDYTTEKEWPLIVFLHGGGEKGADGWRHTEVGIGKDIRWHVERFPCLVVMPQCPEGRGWAAREARGTRPAREASGDHIGRAIEETLEAYNIDEDRITLTGLSMGGYGTWDYGAKNTDTFAALMPICGGGDVNHADKLATLPIWAFHGDADDVIPVERSREMVEAVKKAGGDIKYTEYPGVDHGSWEPAYDDAATIAWLLKQKRD
jgi:predicted peptidase